MPELGEILSDLRIEPLPAHGWFGEVAYRPGGQLGPRVQADVQFVIVQSGWARITIDGQRRDLPADHVCRLLPDGHEHFQFATDRPTHHSWVALVKADAWPERLLEAVGAAPFSLPLSRRMQDVLDLGLEIHRRQTPSDGPVLRHLACAFCHAYLAAAASQTQPRPLPEPVARARRFIELNYRKSIDLADIAKAASVSENHIVRLFSQHLAHTPVRYLWRVRVHRGADLLRDTGLTISEIAYKVGFSTPYHFSRRVKSQLGVSPRELRQAHWGAA